MPEGDRFCGRCGLSRSEDGKPVDPLLGITVAGRYRIERRIGVGGMGTVYLGTHVRIGQKVAIKVLHERYAGDEQLTKRFEKEALTYGQVTHPNLVGLHDYGRTDDGTFFMVLEYCPGISLAQLVRRRGRLDAKLTVDILIQVAQGLGAAHGMGIVHRDLKPENVILTRTRPGRYHARLLDFGIAKRLDDDGPRLTAAGMVFGTPEYMAPEQARGKAVDARSDVYALGCVAYELLTGNPPFIGNDKLRIMHQQAGDPIDAPSSKLPDDAEPIPPTLEAVTMRCLAKSAAERYADTDTLIEALERVLDNGSRRVAATVEVPEAEAVAEPTAPESPAARTGRRSSVVLASSTAASAAASGPTGPTGLGTLPEAPARFSEIIIDGLPTDIGLRSTRPGPSPRALGAAAVVFVSVLAFSAWLFSADGPEPTVEVTAEAAEPAPTPEQLAEQARQAEVARVEAEKAAEAEQRARAEAEQRARAEAEQKARAEAEQKARAEAEKKARAEAEKKARAEAEKKARAEAEKKARLEAERLAAEQRRAEAARKAALAAAHKALRLGRLEDAEAAARKLEAQAPDTKEVNLLVSQISTVRTALAAGKTAFEGADCVKALAELEPVLEIAPGAHGVSHMVNSCRNALPPRQL